MDSVEGRKLPLLVRFMARHMDSDLQHLIEHSAPPLQLANLSTFRSLLFKYKRKAWLCLAKSVVLFLEVLFLYTSFGTEHGSFLGTGPREIREGSGTVSCRHFVKLT